MNKIVSIFWFRRDLRLADNPGLYQAAKTSDLILPIFIIDPLQLVQEGQATRWWLYHSLQSLDESLKNSLNFYQADAQSLLVSLANRYKVAKIFCNRVDEPDAIKQDQLLKKHLADHGIELIMCSSNLLWEPSKIVKADQTAYKVFTPFYKNGCLSAQPPRYPLDKPELLECVKDEADTISLSKGFENLFGKDWPLSRRSVWHIGESAAFKKCKEFITGRLDGYATSRDFPDQPDGVSCLSPHLHFGEISPHQIWYAIQQAQEKNNIPQVDRDCFYKQLGWREFSYNLLYHFPDLPHKNFQEKFDNFPWHHNETFLHAWQQGQTGYPIVDAGMRQLLQTGYMHNRVRMIVASFLVKNLLIDWRLGQAWFWDHLVDADLANNSASWQWVAGCGVDAAPYFRIFNPILQAEKFDPEGIYIRKFVPELKKLSHKYLFQPWKAPEGILKHAGIVLGKNYPMPIVSLDLTRKLALQYYKEL